MHAQPRVLILAGLALSIALGGCLGRSEKDDVASAEKLVASHEYKSAIIQAKNALQKNPKNAEARLLLGQALVETGDAPAAEVELRKALEAGATESNTLPWLAKALLAQGKPRKVILEFAATILPDAASSADLKTTVASAYAQLGERDNALEAVQAALKDWPEHAPAALVQARLVAAGGDTAGALALIEPVLAREPKNISALVLKGDLLRYGQHDRDAALAAYRSAAAADPNSIAAHAAIISMLLEAHEVDAAKAEFVQLKSAAPNHPETRLIEARLAYLGNDFAKTREITEQLLKPYPNDPRILQLAGATALRLNATAQAENYLGQALKVQPRALLPRQMLAQIELRSGQPKKALEVLQPVLESSAPDATSLTLAGQAYLQSGDLARSEAEFAQAAKIDPKSATARTGVALNELAKGNTSAGFAELEAAAAEDTGTRANMALVAARLRANDLDGALKAVDALEKKQPGKPIAPVLRGDIQVRRKDTAAATASFEKALAIDPLYFPATAGLAALELAAGRPDGAKKRFEDLLRKDPKNYRAMLALAELKARAGESKDEVTKAITEAVKASPAEPAPRLLLINFLLGQHDAKGALAAAQDAYAALPNSLELLDRLGAAQLAAGNSQQAVASFTKLASLRPDLPEPELSLAEANIAAKDLDAARQGLERALKIRPGLVAAQRGLAQIALMQDKPQDALATARAMQKSQPKQAAGFVLEGDIQARLGHPEEAATALRSALQLEANAETAIKLHRALQTAKHTDEADRLAAKWIKDHPRDAAFRYYLGDLALARKDFAGAEAHYRSVIELQPNNALALNNVAWLMTQQGQPGAVALATRATELMPNQPVLMDTLAIALAAESQTQRAIEVQKKAIALAPDAASLRLTLAKIYVKAGDRSQARVELERLSKLGDKFPAHGEVADLMKSL